MRWLPLLVANPLCRPLVATVTPQDVRLRIGSDGEEYELVFADEFDVSGRSFGGGTCFWAILFFALIPLLYIRR
jgi:hypothetical protein